MRRRYKQVGEASSEKRDCVGFQLIAIRIARRERTSSGGCSCGDLLSKASTVEEVSAFSNVKPSYNWRNEAMA